MKASNFNSYELSKGELLEIHGGFLQDIIDICVAAYIYYGANKGSVLNYKD